MEETYVRRLEGHPVYQILDAQGAPIMYLGREAAAALRTQLDRLLVLHADDDLIALRRERNRGQPRGK